MNLLEEKSLSKVRKYWHYSRRKQPHSSREIEAQRITSLTGQIVSPPLSFSVYQQAPVQPGDNAVRLGDRALGDNIARRVDNTRSAAGRGRRLSPRQEQSALRDRLPADEGSGRPRQQRVGHPRHLRVPLRARDRRRLPRRDAAALDGHRELQEGQHTDGLQHRGGLLLHHLLPDRALQDRRHRGRQGVAGRVRQGGQRAQSLRQSHRPTRHSLRVHGLAETRRPGRQQERPRQDRRRLPLHLQRQRVRHEVRRDGEQGLHVLLYPQVSNSLLL